LKQQAWAIRAIIEAESDSTVRAAGDHLLHVLENPDIAADIARNACKVFIASCESRKKVDGLQRPSILSVSWWAGVFAIVSTIFAILIGDRGLIPIFSERSHYEHESFVSSGTQEKTTIDDKSRIFDEPLTNWGRVEFKSFNFFLAVLHVLFIVFFLFLRFTQFGSPRRGEPLITDEVRESLRQFLTGWTAIWISWLAFWTWAVVGWGFEHFGRNLQPEIFWSVADSFNMSSALAFFYTFLVLDMPSVSNEVDPARNRSFHFAVLNVSLFSGIVLALSIFGRVGLFGLGKGGPLVLSFFKAISMAYFVGRLDSHYMNVKRWMLAPLYFYVVIQVNWADFEELEREGSEVYLSIFFCLALLLKVYLFVVITYWLHTGKIHRYLTAAAKYDRENRLNDVVIAQ
jgi:hypothetical protein